MLWSMPRQPSFVAILMLTAAITACGPQESTVAEYTLTQVTVSDTPLNTTDVEIQQILLGEKLVVGSEGELPLETIGERRRDYKAVVAISQEDQKLVFRGSSYSLYKTVVFEFTPVDGGGTNFETTGEFILLVPAGDQTEYRFSGRVEGFADDIVFEGGAEGPLVMVLEKGIGLRYRSGEGTIYVGNSEIVHLTGKTGSEGQSN